MRAWLAADLVVVQSSIKIVSEIRPGTPAAVAIPKLRAAGFEKIGRGDGTREPADYVRTLWHDADRWDRFKNLRVELGSRPFIFRASVVITGGQVVSSGYSLVLLGGLSRELLLIANIQPAFPPEEFSNEIVVSPEYAMRRGPNRFGHNGLQITVTPKARPEQFRHAFEVRFGCVYSIKGCDSVDDLLPDAAADERLLNAKGKAFGDANPSCGEEFAYERARDYEAIYLLRLKRQIGERTDKYGWVGTREEFEIVEPLKGESSRGPISIVYETPHSETGSISNQYPEIKFGDLVLWFRNSGFFRAGRCELIPTSPRIIQVVKNVIEDQKRFGGLKPGRRGIFSDDVVLPESVIVPLPLELRRN